MLLEAESVYIKTDEMQFSRNKVMSFLKVSQRSILTF